MSEALRLAQFLENDVPPFSAREVKTAATELRRLYDLHGKANALCRIRAERIKELEAELMEQARVNGMGGEREARLMAVNAELVEALESVVQVWFRDGGINYVDFKPYMEKARAALAKAEASK